MDSVNFKKTETTLEMKGQTQAYTLVTEPLSPTQTNLSDVLVPEPKVEDILRKVAMMNKIIHTPIPAETGWSHRFSWRTGE